MPASFHFVRLRLAPLLWLLLMPAVHAEPSANSTQWLSITVNRAPRDGLWACRVEGDALWLQRDDLQKLGLSAEDAPQGWVNLSARPDIHVTFDPLTQQATVEATQNALDVQQHLVGDDPGQPRNIPQAQPVNAVTLGYSLYASESQGQRQASVQSTVTASGTLPGQLSSSFISRTRTDDNAEQATHTRLMSQWQWDNPASLTRLALGDSITTGTSWSRQVRFGGLHLARNFELNPQLNTAPRAQFSDSVVLPSTVDLYLDGLKQSSQKVTPGSYLLDTLPTFTGSGQAQIVITDLNGQRRTVQLDLYGAPGMLAQGLSSGSLDIGWIRQRYAVQSDNYAAAPMLDAGWRYGISNALTLALHTEQQRALRNVGAGSDWLVSPHVGIVSQHVAFSESRYGSGAKWGVGWQWNGNGLGIAASTVRSDARFADNARMSGSLPARRSDTLWVSQSMNAFGTLGAGWVQQQLQGSTSRYVNASWSATLPQQLTASLSYTRSLTAHSHTFQLTLSIPLGQRDTVALQTTRDASRLDYRHQPDYQAGGWSWQAGQSTGDSRETYADIGYLSRYGEWHLGRENNRNARITTASAEGSLTVLDNTLHALRYNQQGLALVSTQGAGHVPILLENRFAGETDERGYLLLTDLPRYHNSKITLDPLNLPPDVVVPVTEIYARPGAAEAVRVDFDVHPARTVQAKLVNTARQPLPMGSRVSGARQATIVGRDGFVWLEDPPLPGTLRINTAQGECRVTLPALKQPQLAQNMGVLICQ